MIKIGYGTYGMQDVDIFEALPLLKAIGYEAIEICAADGWPTKPSRLSPQKRARLRSEIEQMGFPPAVIMTLSSPCATGAGRGGMLTEFEDACCLANDLNYTSDPAIVTSTLGGEQPAWETGKGRIAACLIELADIAAKYNVVYAIEPHVGGAIDTPQKASWLMRETDHASLKLNFDYSHFHVQGIDLEECLREVAPYAVHAHIKDGHMDNGNVVFTLPGEEGLDLAAFFFSLERIGFVPPVCVEVSGMVWKQPGYEPWLAARQCYDALASAQARE